MVEVYIKGLKELEAAVKRFPGEARTELSRFFQRGLAVYRSGVKNNPWKVGGRGGGSPVRTGGMRDSHTEKIEPFRAYIRPTTNYAMFVHEGTYKMKARPWLDWVKRDKQKEINQLSVNMLDNLVKMLAK